MEKQTEKRNEERTDLEIIESPKGRYLSGGKNFWGVLYTNTDSGLEKTLQVAKGFVKGLPALFYLSSQLDFFGSSGDVREKESKKALVFDEKTIVYSEGYSRLQREALGRILGTIGSFIGGLAGMTYMISAIPREYDDLAMGAGMGAIVLSNAVGFVRSFYKDMIK